MAGDKIVYFTRHAQAEHNVAEDYSIPDAPLTKLGRSQSKELNDKTKELQATADCLIVSPLKRTLSTALDGYPELVARLGKSNVICHPLLQEVNDLPCDTGSPASELRKLQDYDGLDLSLLEPGVVADVDWTSKQGIYAPENVLERVRKMRNYIRSRPEKRIVVVAHGDVLRTLTENQRHTGTPWANAQVREYEFVHPDQDKTSDPDALVRLVENVAKEGGKAPTSGDMKHQNRL